MTDQVTQETMEISGVIDAVKARRRGLELAQELGFSRPDATKIAVVISELSRNILLYAKQGTVILSVGDGDKKFFKIVAEDHGPGIEDLERVLIGGYTTSKGLGLGISGSKRLVDEFDVDTEVGRGTTITAVKWLR